MALTITINGVDQTAKVQAAQLEGGRRLNYNRVAGSPATFTFFTYDKTGGSGGYRPAIDQTVVVVDGATTVSGVITDIREEALSDASGGWDKGILCAVTCADENGLLLRDTYSHEYADGTTVKQVLQDLIANPLAGRGITLDGAQANGPALTGFKFEDAYVDDILNSLTTITGWPWDVTAAGVLSMISPASVSCGFSLTDGGGDLFAGVTAEQGRSENYANRVTVTAGPASTLLKTETITGNGTLDAWVLTYTPVVGANGFIISVGVVTEVGVANRTISEPGGGGFYTWTAATNTLTRTAGALANGQVAALTYSVQFPIAVTVNDAAEQAAHGIYAKKERREDITDIETATAVATGLLSLKIATPKTVHIQHRKGLAQIGRSVTVTIAERNLNATFMIVAVSFWNEVDGNLTYGLEVISGSSIQESWVDYFKRNGSGGSSGPSSISGAIIPAISGLFEGNVHANTGLDDVSSNRFESSLFSYVNSGGAGPGVGLGRPDKASSWVIFADMTQGASAGTVGSLKAHLVRLGSAVECGFKIQEDDSHSGSYIFVPGQGVRASGGIYLGDFAGLISGASPDDRVEGIKTVDIMATAGYFERSRATRMGEYDDVAFSAGNFTANGSMTWTVAIGDQSLYRFSLSGKTMTLKFAIAGSTVGGTPNNELRIAIPGGFTAAQTDVCGSLYVNDNGTVGPVGMIVTTASAAYVGLQKSQQVNWSASTDNTAVAGTAIFEVS